MSQTNAQPDSPVFFVDRNLGKSVVPEALRQAGYLVEAHDDHFAPDTLDTEWLQEVGKRGWAVLTKDRRFKSRLPELIAMIRANTHVFVLREKKLNGSQQADAFVSASTKMVELIRNNDPPILATVTKAGSVATVEGLDELLELLGDRET